VTEWKPQGEYADILCETADGIAKTTISRPEVRNAFRPTAPGFARFPGRP
jgi:1,4-dihydroxy-2-naphthoyl-CoA synthase